MGARRAARRDRYRPRRGRARRRAAVELVGEPGSARRGCWPSCAARADGAAAWCSPARASELERDLPFWVFVDALDDYVWPRASAARARRRRAAELGRVLPALAGAAARRRGSASATAPTRRPRAARAARRATSRSCWCSTTCTGPTPARSSCSSRCCAARPPRRCCSRWRSAAPGAARLVAALEPRRPRRRADALALGALTATRPRAGRPGGRTPALYDESGGNPFYLEQLARVRGGAGAGAARRRGRAARGRRGTGRGVGAAPRARACSRAPRWPATRSSPSSRRRRRRDVATRSRRSTSCWRARPRARRPTRRGASASAIRSCAAPSTGGARRVAARRPRALRGGAGRARRGRRARAARRARARHGDAAAVAVLREAAEAVLRRRRRRPPLVRGGAAAVAGHRAGAGRVGLLSRWRARWPPPAVRGAHAALRRAAPRTPSRLTPPARASSTCSASTRRAQRGFRGAGQARPTTAPPAVALLIELANDDLTTLDYAAMRRGRSGALDAARGARRAARRAAAAASAGVHVGHARRGRAGRGDREQAARSVDALGRRRARRRGGRARRPRPRRALSAPLADALRARRARAGLGRATGQRQLFPLVCRSLHGLALTASSRRRRRRSTPPSRPRGWTGNRHALACSLYQPRARRASAATSRAHWPPRGRRSTSPAGRQQRCHA